MDIREQQIWPKEQEIIIQSLAETVAKPGCKFLEVGSWYGDSTIIIGKVAKKNGGHLFCVDWWKGNVSTDLVGIASKEDVFSFFWNRICCEGLEDVVIPIRGRSEVASEILTKDLFNMVFIDADHRYESVLRDIQQYASLVRKDGGILCGHDCEGRLSDYDRNFLEAGKDVDYYEGVHCGVVLGVGTIFKDYSINYSIWSVQATDQDNSWKPTNLIFPGIKDKRQPPPPPLGFTKNYEVLRYGQLVYAVPRSLNHFDITEEAELNQLGVITAKTLQDIEEMIGESISFASVPILIDSYKGYGMVKYKNRIYAISETLGPIDLTQEDEQNLRKYQEEKTCVIADSLFTTKVLISQLACQNLEKELEERNKKIEALQGEISERDLKIERLHKAGSEKDKNIRELNEEVVSRDSSINALQKELASIKTTLWYRVIEKIKRLGGYVINKKFISQFFR
jgi:hypothetical protein